MDENPKDFDNKFLVVFENTGKEHAKTLEFGHRVETEWGVPIIWLEYCRVDSRSISLDSVPEGRTRSNLKKKQECGQEDHWFKRVDYDTAARSGEPFDAMLKWANGLPNVRTRRCSVQLKLRTRNRFLRWLGINEFYSYIGIRSDESHRATEILANIDKYESPRFPLITHGITKEDVNAWWEQQPFRLEIPNYLGNCDLCFLKAKWKRMAAVRNNPKVADWWIAKEKEMLAKGCDLSASQWILGHSYEALLSDASHMEFSFSEPDIPCSCAVGAFQKGEEE